jgi:GMP synthase (glutamine-hydrolysing)
VYGEKPHRDGGDGKSMRNDLGIQFHPEVTTPKTAAPYCDVLFDICGCKGSWTIGSFIERAVERIREQVGNGRAIVAISGGVDSTVAAALVHRQSAIADGVFVNNGLLAKERIRVSTFDLAEQSSSERSRH